VSPISNNYNDEIYLNKRGRDSAMRNPKNSAGGNMKPKDLDKELDLGFLPKDLLYNDKTYDDSSKNLLAAIEIL